jgi:eukaryotic-like serine/threonine-protein kinase
MAMQFRCPNCQHPIRVEDASGDDHDATIDSVECPSCHSRFSLSGDSEETVVPEEGVKIAHFEVSEILGEGSYGTVYKAWDPELKRHVAVKLPRAGRISKDTSRLFLREARAAADIHHPNVVSVFEVGLHEGRHYIASQFIDGVSLFDWLKTHTLAPAETARLIVTMLRAVQVFHDKGIVHRDLKPGNVLLDQQTQPHIADFGLARNDNPNEMSVSQSGRIVGTLHYMSPEQARGDSRGITSLSDVYSMGVILYEMLTGKKPFKSTSSRTLLHSILTDDPPAPRRVNNKIPKDLETICLKALAKETDHRYASAGQMADDLQRFLDGKPILAVPPSQITRLTKWVRRHVALTVAIVTALIAIAVAVVSFNGDQIPTNAVMVKIHTDPASEQITFTLYDDVFRVPNTSGFQENTASGESVYLLPGLYRVTASTPDGHFHEVWRTVPEAAAKRSAESRYPHLAFARDESGTVVLPEVRLFLDSDVGDPTVLVKGGSFEMGYQGKVGEIAAKHPQEVPDFRMGIHEVSYARFREVMKQPMRNAADSRTYLATFNKHFGDRTDIDGDQPVTGYPIDVAILYCELAGGRLPTNVEYEYVATQHGESSFPGGAEPAVPTDEPWLVLSVSAPTKDTSPEGIRNLYNSVAEYTDSLCVAYQALYPARFSDPISMTFPSEGLDMIMRLREIRGAPGAWVTLNQQVPLRNVRERIALSPMPMKDADMAEKLNHIGWRIYRSIP